MNFDQKLTPSARETLERISKEIDTEILEEAYQVSLKSESRGEEITMNEILEARDKILPRKRARNLKQRRDLNFALLMIALGLSIVCIGITLTINIIGDANQKISWFKLDDPSFIIVQIGVALISVSLVYAVYFSHRRQVSYYISKKNRNLKIQRFLYTWSKIEMIGNMIINAEEGVETQYPLSAIYDYLVKNVIPEKAVELKSILRARNSIVHGKDGDYAMLNIDKYIEEADKIEKLLKDYYTNKVIKKKNKKRI